MGILEGVKWQTLQADYNGPKQQCTVYVPESIYPQILSILNLFLLPLRAHQRVCQSGCGRRCRQQPSLIQGHTVQAQTDSSHDDEINRPLPLFSCSCSSSSFSYPRHPCHLRPNTILTILVLLIILVIILIILVFLILTYKRTKGSDRQQWNKDQAECRQSCFLL